MDTSVIRQSLLFEQDTICIRNVFLPDAALSMAGCVHPAMMNVLAAHAGGSPRSGVENVPPHRLQTLEISFQAA